MFLSDNAVVCISEFAALVKVSRQSAVEAARRCLTGGTWRGVRLDVRVVHGRGGKGGFQYQVRVDSLPADLRTRYWEARGGEPEAGEGESEAVPVNGAAPEHFRPHKLTRRATRKARRRERIVNDVLDRSEHGTAERTKVIREMAGREGKGVSESSIRRWVRAYETENGGYEALCTKVRSDRGVRRVLISEKWDKAADRFGVGVADRDRIKCDLEVAIKQAYHTILEGSARDIQFCVLADFMEASEAAGIDLPTEELMEICEVPKRFIRRFEEHRAVCVFNRDQGQYAAKIKPRIKRDTSNLEPMQWVEGDVWHVDMYVQRVDESLATPKCVAFQDLATGRMFVRVYLLNKHQQIRREHVLETLVAMLADPSWGIPQTLFLDRGGEFNIDLGLESIAALGLSGRTTIRRALPHNPQAKGHLEAAFNTLKRLFKGYIGYIGGNRFKMPTQQQGRKPQPFPGSFDLFKAVFDSTIETYHKRKPTTGKLPPFERFRAFVEDAKWESTPIDFDHGRFRVANRTLCPVSAGGVLTVAGVSYRCDEIMKFANNVRVTAIVPTFGDRSEIWVEYGDGLTARATRVTAFAVDDPAGAGESTRMQKLVKRQIQELAAQTPALLGNLKFNRKLPDPPVPKTHNVQPLDPNYELHRRARSAAESKSDTARRNRDRSKFDSQAALLRKLRTGTDN